MAVNGIEIKVGQKWKTREGVVVTICSRTGPSTHPWVDELWQTYRDDGVFSTVGKGPRDLNELVEVTPPVAEASVFRVGQKWRRRDGQFAKILSTTHHGEAGGRKYPILAQVAGGNPTAYDSTGLFSWVGTPGEKEDLVELIEDTPLVVEAAADKVFPDISEHDRAAGKVKLSDCYLPKEKSDGAPDLLEAAAGHMRDRAATYDKPEGERSMAQTVAIFNLHHGTELTEAQGWHFMQILKDVRLFTNVNKPHRDSVDDCIAYAALKGEAMLKGGAQ